MNTYCFPDQGREDRAISVNTTDSGTVTVLIGTYGRGSVEVYFRPSDDGARAAAKIIVDELTERVLNARPAEPVE